MARGKLNLLLVEPQWLIRSTVVAVGRSLDLPRIEEAASIETATQRLAGTRYDGLLLSLDEREPALALLEKLRAGGFACPAQVPVVVMSADCDIDLARRMKQYDVSRVLLKPFKVKTVLESVDGIVGEARRRKTA
jgi:DNA-binding NarL/FixJ family response regulator